MIYVSFLRDHSFAAIATPNLRNIFAQFANIWLEGTTNRTIVKNVGFAGETFFKSISVTKSRWKVKRNQVVLTFLHTSLH